MEFNGKFVTVIVVDHDGDVLERLSIMCPPDLNQVLTTSAIFEVLDLKFGVVAYGDEGEG